MIGQSYKKKLPVDCFWIALQTVENNGIVRLSMILGNIPAKNADILLNSTWTGKGVARIWFHGGFFCLWGYPGNATKNHF